MIIPIVPSAGKLLSSRATETKKSRSGADATIKDFCGLMGWSNPELLHDTDKAPIEAPQDFLQLNLEKEATQEINTHSLELKHSLKPVSVRQKKKLNKVRD